MAAKKDDITTYTKAELIKALRASVAREAKLQKRVAKLEDQLAGPVTNAEIVARTADQGPYDQFIADVDEGARLALRGDLEPEDQAPPAFPWEPK